MTTPTPTSDAYGGAGGPPIDVATLARMAGEFFAALPGSVPAIGGLPLSGNPLPPGAPSAPLPQATTTQFGGLGAAAPGVNLIPSGPEQVAARVKPSPAQFPHAAAPNGLPDTLATSAPGIDGRLGSAFLGVPEVNAPSLPQGGLPSTAATPSTPFYFLGEGAHQARPGATALPGSADLLPAQPIELPSAPTVPAASAVPQDRAGSFYFIDPQRHPGAHSHHAGHPARQSPDADARAAQRVPFDVHAIRRDFPILKERVNGRPLVWFDNAATTQKPQSVIDRLSWFYEHENSNIHRAAHELAARATDAYESARDKVAKFINASSSDEIVFVRGATEAINLVAKSWGAKNIAAGDEIIVSHLEHHANIVPWQQLAAEKGAHIKVIPVDDSGQVILSEYQRLLGPRTRMVAVTQVSNALGTVVPVHEIVAAAKRQGACTLVDGAQSVSHMAVDVQALDTDFFVFSGHKVFGPTGIGVVYGKKAVLEDMPPWQGGGNMILDVTFERTVYHGPPARFEAGTGNIADAVGLGAAIAYVQRLGLHNISRYEHDLLAYATAALKPIPGLRLIGTARDKASVLSFVLQGHAPEDVGRALNEEGIAVRSGHHCAQPILRRFGVKATVRPSLAFYNTCEEVDRLVAVVRRLARA
jgi:cysteine desulfurase/selenocysteine lyase